MDQLIVLALELLRGIRWHDVLDIVAVAVVLYWILLLIRGTRAVQILAGLMILGFAYLFARGTELNTFGWILENFLGSIVIISVTAFADGGYVGSGIAFLGSLAIFFLELFVAFLQAYIFMFLTAIFISLGLPHDDHGHEEHGHDTVDGPQGMNPTSAETPVTT